MDSNFRGLIEIKLIMKKKLLIFRHVQSSINQSFNTNGNVVRVVVVLPDGWERGEPAVDVRVVVVLPDGWERGEQAVEPRP